MAAIAILNPRFHHPESTFWPTAAPEHTQVSFCAGDSIGSRCPLTALSGDTAVRVRRPRGACGDKACPQPAYSPPVRFLRFLASSALTAVLLGLTSSVALAAPRPTAPTVGYDVSYPQCGRALPANAAFGIVGVSDGLAYGRNPCLAIQYAWALGAPKAPPAFYMNTGNPGAAATRVPWYSQAGPEQCSTANEAGCAYNYGYHAARYALEYATEQTSFAAARSGSWWLDVETANSWSADYALNNRDIQGSIDFLASAGISSVGIYSTGYQWGQITGGAQLGPTLANWVAGASNAKRAATMCASSFSGGNVRLVQYPSAGFDANFACL